MADAEAEPDAALLRIAGYRLAYAGPRGATEVLHGIDLAVAPGECLGLVGESGSGKSSLAWAIMRHLPAEAIERGGTIAFRGRDLMGASPAEIRSIRGRHISMVFQDPSTALNPTTPLGQQLIETLRCHQALGRGEARDAAEALLTRMEIRNPRQLMARFPHEASGGEKQRVVIASALACRPDCIIFDEPTTALDVITAAQILDLFAALRRETGVSSLYISHDLALVARVADRIAVIDKGHIVESGVPREVLRRPAHPYTRSLIDALPQPGRRMAGIVPTQKSPLLAIDALSVRYHSQMPPSLRPTDLTLAANETLGIVGESGSGKSTLARALIGLTSFDGRIRLDGRSCESLADLNAAYRRSVQIVFQHPHASLNPRQRIGAIIGRPLRFYGLTRGRAETGAEIARLLEAVRLPADYATRYPDQISGGEKQRVAIARAFAARPRVVICDEITSSLDVSVQASIVRVLISLQKQFGTAIIFITHDINLARQISHRLAVIRGGIVEDVFPVAEALAPERCAYTKALIANVPSLDPAADAQKSENNTNHADIYGATQP